MNKNPLLRKDLAVGIILLFVGVTAVQSINANMPITDDMTSGTNASNITTYNGTLSGYVTDSMMNPIEGARVRVYFHDTSRENYSDSTGYFHVTDISICNCTKNATCSKDGYNPAWVNLTIWYNTTHDFILTSKGNWLYVGGSGPGNYTRIQDAINASDNGDTVFVFHGTYNEIIEIRKAICLIGEDVNTTIIQDVFSYDAWYAVTVNHVNVTIIGFTIKALFAPYALGLIKGYSTVKGNTIVSDIYMWLSFNNSLFDNNITGHVIVDGFGNVLHNNRIESGWPLELCYSNNTLSNNTFISTGLQSYGGAGNIVVNNTVNGKPLVYLDRVSNRVVEEDAGQIVLVQCENVTIRNQHFTNFPRGIQVLGSRNCYLINNTISSCSDHGIEIYSSNMIMFMGNTINTSTIQIGQWDFGVNNHIIFSRNTFTSDAFGGNMLIIRNSDNVSLSYNNLINTFIELSYYSRNCEFSHNNFLANSTVDIYVTLFPHTRFSDNYWGRPRLVPKFILGTLWKEGEEHPELLLPWFFIDWHPAQKPYDIPG